MPHWSNTERFGRASPLSSHSQLVYPPISPEIGHVATRLAGSLSDGLTLSMHSS